MDKFVVLQTLDDMLENEDLTPGQVEAIKIAIDALYGVLKSNLDLKLRNFLLVEFATEVSYGFYKDSDLETLCRTYQSRALELLEKISKNKI